MKDPATPRSRSTRKPSGPCGGDRHRRPRCQPRLSRLDDQSRRVRGVPSGGSAWRATWKVGAYTDAARRFTTALEKITPDTRRALWVDLGFYRGAALQALGLLEDGADAIRCLDEAAASFRAVAECGTADGTVHPIAAYNLHVVLEHRARLAPGRTALPFLTEARRSLLQAMEAPAFAASKVDNESRLAVLDAAISAAG